ncbi:MAG TPA: zinc metallopeptidase [Candidatus Limnocylindria bacterium]|nr:zinc metallopeptidase [Candidatus Limnocylindria bacterium]
MFGAGYLPYILLVMLPSIGLSLWAAWRVRSTYSRWSSVDSGISMNPFDFARYLLNSQGLTDVGIEATPGNLTDHYDPRGKVLRVSSSVAAQMSVQAPGYADRAQHLSVATVAVIAHEVGHAAQHRSGDPQMALRQLIVPVANIGSTLAPWLIIAGVIFRLTGLSLVGLAFFAVAVVFTFVTLPVEFGASRRALAYVEPLGLTGERADGARSVLRAAGWTYVAAALTALLTFVYYLSLFFGSRR